ncbi:DUF2950 domain-containing protein [Hyphomicrobium sp. CS1GBMeth3]|uniref:DUF2950 domain-containing protein n=1 Tax=Hyphomicrobium sp. CS1GBMeth3 TaxID=1892845 RepID=UPI00093135AE|nr:DUF2950 domain-containing protein [Hyphomicrobium sp. CS1GBMeth3]
MILRGSTSIGLASWFLAASVAVASPVAAGQQTYTSPQAAVDALVDAARSGDIDAILDVLGSDGREIASSGDAVADANARERFVAAYDEGHEIHQAGSGPTILYVGKDDFPFPLPLVAEGGKWRFDTAAGAEEILDRRIGENELAAIEVLRAYVDAQREYAEVDHDGRGVQYARRLVSRDGKHDGLYWPTAEGEAESPLGPLVAEARAEGYRRGKARQTPYHGYLYRILTEQGSNAAGGRREYIARGRMIGGFAMIATPAEYGNSGVKSFIVNQDGEIFENDLGENSARIASRIETFDPGTGWAPVGSTP